MLPDHVGSPLGENHGGATYFMLEIHYDNPELKTCKSLDTYLHTRLGKAMLN